MKKRLLISLICILAAVFGVCFIACNQGNVDASDKQVAITVAGATENQTLANYMVGLEDKGELTFSIENGMITKINGVANTTNTYWMLYTDDSEHANSAWGTYEYNGKTLGSATLGAESLTVVNGCVYVWVYTTF